MEVNTTGHNVRPVDRKLVAFIARTLPVRVLGALDVVRLGDVLVDGALTEHRTLLRLCDRQGDTGTDSLHC